MGWVCRAVRLGLLLLLQAVGLIQGQSPLRVITPTAPAAAANAQPAAAAAPADPYNLPKSINTTDPLSPDYPMWPGAMQYLQAMAANASFPTQDAAAAAAKGFVVRNGTQLYRNGKPFYFVGGNAYWLVDKYTMSWGREHMDEFFDTCQALGLHVIRTWIFNIGLPKSRATYDSRQLAGLDYIIWSAKQRGLMLVFCLGNSWNAYKGPEEFVEMATGSSEGKDILDFYGDPATRALYKLHIWGLITRVNPLTGLAPRDDPTIFAWNLLNEPRCPGCMEASQQATHQGWLADTARFLRAVDPLHLISAATEGFFVEDHHTLLHFYNPGPRAQCDGEDWFKISTIPEIDYTTIHVYERHMELLPRPSGHDGDWPNWVFCGWDCYVNWFKNYVGLHLFLSQHVLKKPLVVEEFGLTYYRMTLPQQRVLFKVLFDMQLQSAQSNGALAGTMFWNAARNDSTDSDGYNIQIDRPAYMQPASAIPAPENLPATVASATLAREIMRNATYEGNNFRDVIFTSEGAPPLLAAQMAAVQAHQQQQQQQQGLQVSLGLVQSPLPAAVVSGVTNASMTAPSAAAAETAAAAAVSAAAAANASAAVVPAATAALPAAPVVPAAPAVDNFVSVATAPLTNPAAAAATAAAGVPTSPADPGSSEQRIVMATASGRKLLFTNALYNHQQQQQQQQQQQRMSMHASTAAANIIPSSSSSSSSSSSGRELLISQDHLDAFRRGGWREACAVEAAKTWRPYKLFNISDTVSNNPEYQQLLQGGDVVGVISEATAKMHQLVAGQQPLAVAGKK